MGCQECDKAYNRGSITKIAFYRWKNANVGIIGCSEHIREIFEVLTKHQELLRKENNGEVE